MIQNESKLEVSIEKEMKKSYLDYAMSVIIGRALPDVRDGLKPVHRRVLFAMQPMPCVWRCSRHWGLAGPLSVRNWGSLTSSACAARARCHWE